MKFMAHTDIYRDGVDVLMELPGGDVRRIIKPLVFEVQEVRRGDYISDPTMRLEPQAAQSLMDALWHCGLRPTEAKYPNDHVNALRDHLADMRRLVFEPAAPVITTTMRAD